MLGQKSPDATTICVEESLSYKYVDYLKEIFPKAKFIFAIRDGRTVIHSLITKRVPSIIYIYLIILNNQFLHSLLESRSDLEPMGKVFEIGREKCNFCLNKVEVYHQKSST